MDFKHGFTFLCFLLLLLSLGCGTDGPPLRPVEGSVSYLDKKLKNGSVVFVPMENLPSSVGIIDSDGKFKMKTRINGIDRDGCPIGDHKVMIISIQDTTGRFPEDRAPLPPPNIPMHYGDTSLSNLTAKVEDKTNLINFDLK